MALFRQLGRNNSTSQSQLHLKLITFIHPINIHRCVEKIKKKQQQLRNEAKIRKSLKIRANIFFFITLLRHICPQNDNVCKISETALLKRRDLYLNGASAQIIVKCRQDVLYQ